MSVLLREAIGGSIRRARTERNRTLRDVSHSARVSLGYLSEIERGRKEPSSELLAAICEALALPLPDLLDEVADALRPDVLLPDVLGPDAASSPVRRPRPVTVLDPALRTAVEEALEPAQDEVPGDEAGEADASEAVPIGGAGDGVDGADGADGTDGPSACLVEEIPSDDDPDGSDEPEVGDDEPEVGDDEPEVGDDVPQSDDPAGAPVLLVGRAPLTAPLGASPTTVRVAA